MARAWANDDGRVSTKTSGSAPTTWPSFVDAAEEEAPALSLHQIESLGGKLPGGSKSLVPDSSTDKGKGRAILAGQD